MTAGLGLALLGLTAGVATAVLAASPPVLLEAVAGLPLLGALGASLASAAGIGEHGLGALGYTVAWTV